jgi:hypothetical protein
MEKLWKYLALSELVIIALSYWWLGFDPAPSLPTGVEVRDRWKTITKTEREIVTVSPDGTTTTEYVTVTESVPKLAKSYVSVGVVTDGRKLTGYTLGVTYRLGDTPLLGGFTLGTDTALKFNSAAITVTLELR